MLYRLLVLFAATLAVGEVNYRSIPMNLQPIRNPLSFAGRTAVKPSSTVNLTWGDDSPSIEPLVSVNVDFKYPAVMLEDVGDALVNCYKRGDEFYVAVKFKNAEEFEEALRDWVAPFVLITNHWGGCDVDFERGYFVASSVKIHQDAMKIVANAQKSDPKAIASM